MKKLILHIPHSSTNITLREGFIADETQIHQEIIKLTDWYTDELFHSDSDEMIVTPFSRLFCDVERFVNDEDEVMSKVGMGAVYERFDNGDLLRKVTTELRVRIIENFYNKHHIRLTEAVESELALHDSCLIIDCHSFPSKPLLCALDQSGFSPDFNIGTDVFHTPKEIVDVAYNYFTEKGYSVGIDAPYSGTIVPLKYYKKSRNVNSIMLEVNRKLYLDEPTNEKSLEFEKTKTVVHGFIEMMKKFKN